MKERYRKKVAGILCIMINRAHRIGRTDDCDDPIIQSVAAQEILQFLLSGKEVAGARSLWSEEVIQASEVYYLLLARDWEPDYTGRSLLFQGQSRSVLHFRPEEELRTHFTVAGSGNEAALHLADAWSEAPRRIEAGRAGFLSRLPRIAPIFLERLENKGWSFTEDELRDYLEHEGEEEVLKMVQLVMTLGGLGTEIAAILQQRKEAA